MKNKKIILLLMLLALTGCKKETYTVTFDTLGGTVLSSILVEEGDTIENIDKPTKEGYLFVNWIKDGIEYNELTPINSDITLTANWILEPEIPNTYTVTMVIDSKTEKMVVKENETIKEPQKPVKTNYVFKGWYVGNKKYDFNSKITEDITIVAKFEYNLVTVTYDLDGGIGLALETIKKNTTLPIPEPPVKPGYKFLKWTSNGEDFSFNTKISKNITLKAVWEEIEYIKVIFDTDGGEVINYKIIEKYSKIDNLPVPVKEGYEFVEWQINNKKFNIDNIISNDIILKAVYKEILIEEE